MILPTDEVKNLPRLKKYIDDLAIDFFDFGCSHGGAIQWIMKHTGKRGLGFDLDKKKLRLADEAGLLCTNTDILEIQGENLVPFVSIFHLLEHLYSRPEAYAFIDKACSVSRDNVIIEQPFFDADQLLFADGFKTYYSHWGGHRNHMTTTDLFYHLRDLKGNNVIRDFTLGYKLPILSSDDKKIHSLESPFNSLEFDAEKHPPKKEHYTFPYRVYYEIIVGIDISGNGYGDVFKKLSPDMIQYDTKKSDAFK